MRREFPRCFALPTVPSGSKPSAICTLFLLPPLAAPQHLIAIKPECHMCTSSHHFRASWLAEIEAAHQDIPRQHLHESDAPTSVGARHSPRSVRILCTDFVAGSTHAASRPSSVMNPSVWSASSRHQHERTDQAGSSRRSSSSGSAARAPSQLRSSSAHLPSLAGREKHTLECRTLEVHAVARLRVCGRLDELDPGLLAVLGRRLHGYSAKTLEDLIASTRTQRTMAKLLTPRMFAGFKLH
jgi:hypothetical protein